MHDEVHGLIHDAKEPILRPLDFYLRVHDVFHLQGRRCMPGLLVAAVNVFGDNSL